MGEEKEKLLASQELSTRKWNEYKEKMKLSFQIPSLFFPLDDKYTSQELTVTIPLSVRKVKDKKKLKRTHKLNWSENAGMLNSSCASFSVGNNHKNYT